jgi:hypothetical protein
MIAPTTETSKPGPAAPKRVGISEKAAKPTAKKAPKAAATKKRAAKPASKKTYRPKSKPRTDTKKAIVLDLLCRKQDETTTESAKATHWRKHSVRGIISRHVTRKMGLKLESDKNEAGERSDRIAK